MFSHYFMRNNLYLFLYVLLYYIKTLLAHSYPDYYEARTFTHLNGTMKSKTSLKMFSSNAEYNSYGKNRDSKIKGYLESPQLTTIPPSYYNTENQPPVNVSGKMHKVHFTQGIISDVEVLDEFNYDGGGTVPVRISTTWFDFTPEQSIDHTPGKLATAIQNDHLMNVTMSILWKYLTVNETLFKNAAREWEIDEYLCYYGGSSARFNAFGKCVIPYTEIIEHYKRLWNEGAIPVAVNGVRTKVSNDYDFLVNTWPCSDIADHDREDPCKADPQCGTCTKNATFEKILYIPDSDQILDTRYYYDREDAEDDGWYDVLSGNVHEKYTKTYWYQFDTKPTAMGWSINTTYGYNKLQKSYDVNFTVLFNNWTFDFPQGFLDNYRDESFLYDKMYLDIYYWIADPIPIPDREVPASFYIIVFIMIGPTFILFSAIVLLICTRSRLGFNVKIWEFKNGTKARELRRAEMNHKKNDNIQDKLWEKENDRLRAQLEEYGVGMNVL